MLHRFGLDKEYERFRLQLLGVPSGAQAKSPAAARQWEAFRKRMETDSTPARRSLTRNTSILVAQRSTPPLFGLGVIDSISDTVLRAEADRQAERGVVSGRIPAALELANPYASGPFRQRVAAGKFGWRGQSASLRSFVLGACANELGLEVPGHGQPGNPLQPDYRGPGFDLSEEQCESLVTFVASLPAPKQIVPTDEALRDQADWGLAVFHRIGCAECHVQDLGAAQGIFSDLLLHDMGRKANDPLPAGPSLPATPDLFGPSSKSFASSYLGPLAGIDDDPQRLREWRTPPLWGVRDTAPYLHDGRAPDLTAAIVMHGGEAETSQRRFVALSARDREALLAFLNTLAAPAE